MKRSGIRDGPVGFHCAVSGLRVLKALKALPVAVVAPLLSGLFMYWPTVPWMRLSRGITQYPRSTPPAADTACCPRPGSRLMPT
jgi:hypothetical protein